jgi:hypothetical protein
MPRMPTDSTTNEHEAIVEHQLIDNRWRVCQLIGGGGFGRIFAVSD